MKLRFLLPGSVFLLGTDTCTPMLPEADPVISSSPEVVADLREHYAEVLGVLDAVEKGESIVLPPDGEVFQHLSTAYLTVPGGEALLSAQIRLVEEPLEGCGDDGYIVYTLEVSVRPRPRRSPKPTTIEATVCEVDFMKPEQARLLEVQGEHAEQVNMTGLRPILADNLRLIYWLISDYMEAFEVYQHNILGKTLGCPDGTRFNHTYQIINPEPVQEYWCERSGVRHGPFIKGELDPFLSGTRLIEGHFDSGMRDGHWILRDASGTITEESWWARGVQVEAPAEP